MTSDLGRGEGPHQMSEEALNIGGGFDIGGGFRLETPLIHIQFLEIISIFSVLVRKIRCFCRCVFQNVIHPPSVNGPYVFATDFDEFSCFIRPVPDDAIWRNLYNPGSHLVSTQCKPMASGGVTWIRIQCPRSRTHLVSTPIFVAKRTGPPD